MKRLKLDSELVQLRRITDDPSEIELIRELRNSFLDSGVYWAPHFIEAEEHKKWFAGLDPLRDFFFVILSRNTQQPIGFAGCCQKNAPAGSAEISIYFQPGNNSPLSPFHSMELLLDFLFNELGMSRAFGAFAKSNVRAIRFNSSFGFRKFFENDQMIKTELLADAFHAMPKRCSPRPTPDT